jgi:hypothetical protein
VTKGAVPFVFTGLKIADGLEKLIRNRLSKVLLAYNAQQ